MELRDLPGELNPNAYQTNRRCEVTRKILCGPGSTRTSRVGLVGTINLNPAVGGLREARNRRKPPRWGQKRRVWWFTLRVSNLRLRRGRRSPTPTPVGFPGGGAPRAR